MIPQPQPINTQALLAFVRVDPRAGCRAADVLEIILAGHRSTADIAAVMGITDRAIRHQLKKLRTIGVLDDDIRTSALHEHPDPMPCCFGEWHTCHHWLAAKKAEVSACKSSRKAEVPLPNEGKKAEVPLPPLPQGAAAPCDRLKRVLAVVTAASQPIPRVQAHARRDSSVSPENHHHQGKGGGGLPSQSEWTEAGFAEEIDGYRLEPKRPTHDGTILTDRLAPRGFSPMHSHWLRNGGQMAISDCDGRHRRLIIRMNKDCGLSTWLIEMAVLCFSADRLEWMIEETIERARDYGAYLARLIRTQRPDVDLYRALPLMARTKTNWSIQHGSLVIQTRTQGIPQSTGHPNQAMA